MPNYRPEIVIPVGSLFASQRVGTSLLTPTGSLPASGELFEWELEAPYSSLYGAGPNGGSSTLLAIDLDRDPLTAVLADAPQHGTVAPNSDGSFIYTPAADSGTFRTDTFSYRVTDGVLLSDDAIFVVIRQHLGQGQARSESFSLMYDRASTFNLNTLLANDRFASGMVASPFARGIRIKEGVAESPQFGASLRLLSDLSSLDAGGEVLLGDDFYYTQHPNTDETDASTFDFAYAFLYGPPGLPTGPLVSELLESEPARVLIDLVVHPEADTDGVLDAIESRLGDANNDQMPDSAQPNVATLTAGLFTNTTSDRWVTLVSEAHQPV